MIPEPFPWIRFLPREEARAFQVELVSAFRAVKELGSPAPVVQVITEWRHTAEVHADPELLAALTQDSADHGPVPPPS